MKRFRILYLSSVKDAEAGGLITLNPTLAQSYNLIAETGGKTDVLIRGEAFDGMDKAQDLIREELNRSSVPSKGKLIEIWDGYNLWGRLVLAFRTDETKPVAEETEEQRLLRINREAQERGRKEKQAALSKEEQAKREKEAQEEAQKAKEEADAVVRILQEMDEKGKKLPYSYKVQRQTLFDLAKTQRNLFTDMEEAEKMKSGKYVIKTNDEIRRAVTDYDICCFFSAVAQVLYNQSYKMGHEKMNTGLTETETKKKVEDGGKFVGDICESAQTFGELAYGTKPNGRQLATMSRLIDILYNTEIEIRSQDSKGKTLKVTDTLIQFKRKFEYDGSVYYHLHLHPIFCKNVAKGYALFPQDMSEKLRKVTKRANAKHYYLIWLLGVQDKRKPYTVAWGELIQALHCEEAYRKDNAKTRDSILRACESVKELGVIDGFSILRNADESIVSVTFQLNPEYGKKPRKKDEKKTDFSDQNREKA